MSDNTQLNSGSGGDLAAADDIGGVKFQRIKVIFGDDGVNEGDVSTGNPLPVELMAAAVTTTVVGTVHPPAITKGTQGALGMTTQDLKDAGRVVVNAATAIAGVTAVIAEAMLALDVSRDFAATASATSIAVTAGKRYRITGITVGFISTAAAVLSGRISLRVNPSGAAVATSPIHKTIALSSGAALAQAGNQIHIAIPDGLELSGTMQAGLSQVFNAATGTVWASIDGYEF